MAFSIYTVKEDTLADGAGFTATSQRKLARLSTGRIYIAYIRSDGSYNQVYVSYSDNDGENWTEEKVTNTSTNKETVSLIVDSNDKVYVFFRNSDGIYFCTKPYEGSWSAATAVGTNTYWPSVAIDGNDKIWLVTISNTVDRMYFRYSINDGVDWTVLDYIDARDTSNRPSITIDSDNNVHVSYAGASSPYNFYYIKYNASTETMGDAELVMTTPYRGELFSCIAIDSNNIPHVVMQHRYSAEIRSIYYANRIGGSWSNTILSSTSYNNYRPTIAIDSDDDIYVAFHGYHAGSVSYYQIAFRKSIDYGENWSDVSWLTSGSIQNRYTNLLWAKYPVIGGLNTNIPNAGCFFGYAEEAIIKVQVDSDLSWAEAAPPTADTMMIQSTLG